MRCPACEAWQVLATIARDERDKAIQRSEEDRAALDRVHPELADTRRALRLAETEISRLRSELARALAVLG